MHAPTCCDVHPNAPSPPPPSPSPASRDKHMNPTTSSESISSPRLSPPSSVERHPVSRSSTFGAWFICTWWPTWHLGRTLLLLLVDARPRREPCKLCAHAEHGLRLSHPGARNASLRPREYVRVTCPSPGACEVASTISTFWSVFIVCFGNRDKLSSTSSR
jgi:hypothetical protein